MAGVVASLITNDNVEPLGEQIDNLAFAFIAPLGADDRDNHRSEIRDQNSADRGVDTQEARLRSNNTETAPAFFVRSGYCSRGDMLIEHARDGLLRGRADYALLFSTILKENQSGYPFDPEALRN